jgi:hypothetical protein
MQAFFFYLVVPKQVINHYMQRRDIFNLFLKGISMDDPVLMKPEPVIDLFAYFKKDEMVPVDQQWMSIDNQDHFKPQISTAYAFTITLEVNDANLMPAVMQIALKDDVEQSNRIELGYNESGKLFIGQTIDDRILPAEKLKSGFQLVLNVNPLKNGMTHAKLKAIDNAGLTLSIIKSDKIRISDWTGDIKIPTRKYNFLRIQGYKSI